VYLNFVGDEGQARIRVSFGEVTSRRLAKLKARLDPDGRFAPQPTHRTRNGYVNSDAEAGTDDQYLVLCCGIMESSQMESCLECETT